MKIALLSPVAWRTPPRHYGPWEQVASNLTEGLVALGHDVTLFATEDSVTDARLDSVVSKGYAEDVTVDAKVAECMHISNLMEKAGDFDLVAAQTLSIFVRGTGFGGFNGADGAPWAMRGAAPPRDLDGRRSSCGSSAG